MLTKNFLAILVAFLLVLSNRCSAISNAQQSNSTKAESTQDIQPDKTLSVRVDAFSLASASLGSERQFWIHLPADYHSPDAKAEHYPVVYVLDGQRLTLPVSSIVDYYSQRGVHSQLPQVIVVGVTSQDRGAELTPTHVPLTEQPFPFQIKNSGQSDDFRTFLNDELVPYIDKQFRTAPHRTLIGHSLGGLFVVNESTKTQSPFRAFVALDPSLWWDRENNLNQFGQKWQAIEDPRKLFIARVTYPKNDAHQRLETPVERLQEELDHASDLVKAKIHTLDGLDHGSCVIPGTQRGLFDVFSLFPMDVREVAQAPEKLSEHFRQYSSAMGYQILPPPEVVQWMIQFNRRNGKSKTAEAFETLLSQSTASSSSGSKSQDPETPASESTQSRKLDRMPNR